MSNHIYDDFFLDGENVTDDEPQAVAVAAEPESAVETQNSTTRKRSTATTVASRPRGRGPDLHFDLETWPDSARVDSFNLPPLPVYEETPADQLPDQTELITGTIDSFKAGMKSILPPPEWLDALAKLESETKKPRDGIFKLIDEKRGARQAIEAAKAERIKLLSVTPEYCAIAAIGYATGNDEVVSLVVGDSWEDTEGNSGVTDEVTILEEFWSLVATHGRLIGFNILGFDLPVIYARSAILGVAPTKLLDLKPWGNDVLDLYAVRFPKGGSGEQPRKLKQIAPLYGVEVPAGDMEGSQVFELMTEGKFEEVGEYVRSDVTVARGLWEKLRGFYWV